MPFDLTRFRDAVDDDMMSSIKRELSLGKKVGHWMWFIFPQGMRPHSSPVSQRFAIRDLDHAREFLKHDLLGHRLVECTRLVLTHSDKTPLDVFGHVDSKKFLGCMTLFSQASKSLGSAEHECFQRALDVFFNENP
tara:strand:- start:81 stop:488 length:408 start_codon:yes stop_codon:yes gene_type:complete